jgi:hypothetical protein
MVAIGMNLMSPKVIGRKACLWAKVPLKLSKDREPKRCLNIYSRDKLGLYESKGGSCTL